MLISFRRKVFALSIVIAFCLLVVHLSFQPFNADKVRDFVSGSLYGDVLVGNLLEPSATPTFVASPETVEIGGTETQSTLQPSVTPSFHVDDVPEKVLVVAKVKAENTSWIEEDLSDWHTAIYTVDDQNAPLHTSRNKGHEASVYLTYIIDHYASLPPLMIFLHSHRNHKHGTRAPSPFDYDNLLAIRALNLTYVHANGYASLRCLTLPGCPAELLPFRPDEERDPLRPQEKAMIRAWAELFDNDDVPDVIATPCCAQFAVSREQVLKRPKSEYERFLNWLYETELNDFTSGRIFEYLWHVIFGKEAVYCPDQQQCYWDQFGMVVPPDAKGEGKNASSSVSDAVSSAVSSAASSVVPSVASNVLSDAESSTIPSVVRSAVPSQGSTQVLCESASSTINHSHRSKR